LKALREEGWEMTGFFYNPNIHPYQEYQRRLETVKEYERQAGVKMIYRDEYDLEGFLRGVVYREHERCRYCYSSRLEATAQMAKAGGFDAFTTTLLYSKHQNHSPLKEIGEGLGKRFSVPFYYEDFRKGWQEGIRESKAMGLYRQHYCGCIYSEKERYWGKKE
jgi:predicted adenine nucleotide alpha hydrolase (AANH) superfamily ATPase